jgi:predicted RNA-binding Zn ribbon-like protein
MQIAGVAAEQLFVDFVNSDWYDGRGRLEDRLLDHGWRNEFLREWNLGDPGDPPRRTLRRLYEVRALLRRIVEQEHAGRSPSMKPMLEVVASFPPVPMRLEIGGKPVSASWAVRSPSWSYVQAEIIRSCVEFLSGPARARLRRCENEGCLWAFVDASRNGSRRWCDPGICGNVAKVRAYRARSRNPD